MGVKVNEIHGRFLNSDTLIHGFFRLLCEKYPVHSIKAIAFSTPECLILSQHGEWMKSILTISNQYLHSTRVRFISFLQESCVACLHHGKDLGRSYLEGEKAIFILAFEGANSTNYLSIYLSEKVDFGWKFLKSVVNPYDDNPEAIIEECLEELGVDIYDINHVFSRIFYDPSLKLALPDLFDEVTILVDGTEACKEEILKAGKYLSMIYAKNGNYDCYVPHVLEQKFKLHVGNQIIPLPIQFKPFPYNLSVKITLEENVNNLDLFCMQSIIPSNFVLIRSIPYTKEERNIIFTLHTNLAYQISFSVELDNKERKVIEESTSKMIDFDGYPQFFLSNLNVFRGTYYKHGLQFKIEADGESLIPAVVNFSKNPPSVGQHALNEDGTKCWLFQTMLMDDHELNFYGERSSGMYLIKGEENDGNKLVIKVGNEWKKMSVEKLFAVFIKSMLKLLEEKMNEKVDKMWFNFTVKDVYDYPTTKRLLDLMDVKFDHKHFSENHVESEDG